MEETHKSLPTKNVYLNVNRQAIAVDKNDPCGIYIGMSTGQIFYSRDGRNSWEMMMDYLPSIYSIECARV